MNTKTTVIYHRADFDGIFCREIARKFLGNENVEYIGWDFADPPLNMPEGEGAIYILDLPCDRTFGVNFATSLRVGNPPVDIATEWLAPFKQRIIWIDHHASSIASHPTDIPGYRIDGVSACRLAWQWFGEYAGESVHIMPTKQMFVDRQVTEPLAVRLAGEYDIWDKRDPRAELFQHGLRSRELNDACWELLLSPYVPESDGKKCAGQIMVEALLENGEILQYASQRQNESIIKEMGFTFQWEGLRFLACNHARYNSHLFTASVRPEHDALFGFKFIGHCAGGEPCEQWSISLYHAPGKEHHDLSQIAKKYGGGGHRGACGFRTSGLPFLHQ